MGQNRRYECYARPVDPETEDEATALRTIAGFLETGTPLITDPGWLPASRRSSARPR